MHRASNADKNVEGEVSCGISLSLITSGFVRPGVRLISIVLLWFRLDSGLYIFCPGQFILWRERGEREREEERGERGREGARSANLASAIKSILSRALVTLHYRWIVSIMHTTSRRRRTVVVVMKKTGGDDGDWR